MLGLIVEWVGTLCLDRRNFRIIFRFLDLGGFRGKESFVGFVSWNCYKCSKIYFEFSFCFYSFWYDYILLFFLKYSRSFGLRVFLVVIGFCNWSRRWYFRS